MPFSPIKRLACTKCQSKILKQPSSETLTIPQMPTTKKIKTVKKNPSQKLGLIKRRTRRTLISSKLSTNNQIPAQGMKCTNMTPWTLMMLSGRMIATKAVTYLILTLRGSKKLSLNRKIQTYLRLKSWSRTPFSTRKRLMHLSKNKK